VSTYKQADLTLTGTMRKAQLTATATKTSRRISTLNHANSPAPNGSDQTKLVRRASTISTISQCAYSAEEKLKSCDKCQIKFSPKWWPLETALEGDELKLLCQKCHWGFDRAKRDVNGEFSKTGLFNGVDSVED
jgi:hypothetical protein